MVPADQKSRQLFPTEKDAVLLLDKTAFKSTQGS